MLYSLQPSPIFSFLSPIYGSIVRLRNYCYEKHLFPSYQSTLPVICVGNITVGGSGKSPFVRYVAELFQREGKRPVILSRGYGGKIKQPHLVTAADAVELIGDEARMQFLAIGTRIPIVLAPQRVEGAKFIEKHSLGDVILLDDGFQHLALSRNINLLLLDVSSTTSMNRWLKGCLLPGGWLRESLSEGIKRAQALIYISKSLDETAFPLSPENSKIPHFRFQFQPKEFRELCSDESVPITKFQKHNSVALTAIAQPESFFALLRGLQINIQEERVLPDHAFFQAADIQMTSEAAILCTEKDATKLRSLISQAGKAYYLKLEGKFVSENDERAFLGFLEAQL